jgi:hypothetical protein
MIEAEGCDQQQSGAPRNARSASRRTLSAFLGVVASLHPNPSVLSAWNGEPLNTAAIGRRIGASRTAAAAWIRRLERDGRVLLIPHLGGRHRPLLYTLWSARGKVVAEIVTRVRAVLPETTFAWWMTGRVRRIDLMASTATERIGICLVAGHLVAHRHYWPLRIAHRRYVIDRGFVLSGAPHAFVAARVVLGLPLRAFLGELEDWILCRRSPEEARPALHRINSSAARW